MKLIRCLSLICCALGVFVNVALGGILLSHKSNAFHFKDGSKQIAIEKLANDFNLNTTELEEDNEIDGDEDIHFSFHEFLYYENQDVFKRFQVRNTFTRNVQGDVTMVPARKVPFFITYENFRI